MGEIETGHGYADDVFSFSFFCFEIFLNIFFFQWLFADTFNLSTFSTSLNRNRLSMKNLLTLHCGTFGSMR